MSNYNRSINKQLLLDQFEQEVKCKNYLKLPYSTWRELKNIDEAYLNFCFDYISNLIYVSKHGPIGFHFFVLEPKDRLDFPINDGSFGQYLFVNFFTITCSEPENSSKIEETVSSINNLKTAIASSKTSIENLCNSIGSYTIAVDNHNCYDCSNYNEKKETKNMNTSNLFNFDFGPASSNQFRMSPYGLAIHTQTNGWVAYNSKTDELMDVEVLNFDISKMIYKMPVALNAIKPGDIIIHNGKPAFVRVVFPNDDVRVVDYANATISDILPIRSPFGFNFLTKVCSLFNFDQIDANSDNPFGNMLPFLMMSGENNDFDPTLLIMASMMMNNNQNLMQNPMMMYFLMNRSDKNDILPFLMMNNNMFAAAPVNPPAASK